MLTRPAEPLKKQKKETQPIKVVEEFDDFTGTLLSIAKMTRALVAVEIADMGLHVGQDVFLLALEDDEEVTVSEMAERVSVRPSTVSKMLDRLVTNDFAERLPCPTDSRVTLVRATPKGQAMKRAIRDVRQRIDNAILVQLSDTDRLLADLRAVEGAVRKRLLRMR